MTRLQSTSGLNGKKMLSKWRPKEHVLFTIVFRVWAIYMYIKIFAMSDVLYKSDTKRRKVLFSIMAHRSGKWVAFVTLVSIREISTLSIPFLFKIWRHFVSYVYVERWLIVGAWPHLAMKEFENSTEHNSKCSFRNTGKKMKEYENPWTNTREKSKLTISELPLCQNECAWETIQMKMSSALCLHFHAKLIFVRKVLHKESFRNRGPG